MQRLERWGGAAENDSCSTPPATLEPRPLERDVAGMIARRGSLLVARFMLLVHHDRAEPYHRGEHRRARSHRDPSLAAAQGTPGVGPLAVRQSRMQDRHLVTEDSAHPRDRLGRERNLRYEDDRPLSGGHQA